MHVSLDSALGRQRRLNSVGESVLQIAPNAAAAYSLRSLTGGDPKVVRVRRDTDGGAGDNDEQDFTASGISSGALVAFVGSGNDGFVETWYDQSGNGKDATQATAASQPKIVSAGSLLNKLDFDGTANRLDIDFGSNLSQPNSIFMVHQSSTTLGAKNEFFDELGNTGQRTLLDQSSANYRIFSGLSATTNFAIDANKNLVTAIYNGASSILAKNGTAQSSLNAGTQGISSTSAIGFSEGTTAYYQGSMREFIIYNSDQTANRVALETNINSQYSIF